MWDVTLEFSPLGDTSGDKPTVFTVVREQLGLRLESGRAPLDVLVIEAVQRPSAN